VTFKGILRLWLLPLFLLTGEQLAVICILHFGTGVDAIGPIYYGLKPSKLLAKIILSSS
jgi:hypothetical protein